MTDKERETPNWNPPEPPWNPEPSPLSIKATPEPEPPIIDKDTAEPELAGLEEFNEVFPVEPEPVNMGLEDKVKEMVEDGDLKLEKVDAPGLLDYTVKCPTGITVNGKVYEGGPHAVSEDIYETLSKLDEPYQ